jgi:hypothetical protein
MAKLAELANANRLIEGARSSLTVALLFWIALSGSVFVNPAHAQLIPSAWSAGTEYPGDGIGYQGCGASGGYIFCTGGYNEYLEPPFYNEGTAVIERDESWYAPISASGIGAWQQTTSYPHENEGQSCAVWNGSIYCVGGWKREEVLNTDPNSGVQYNSWELDSTSSVYRAQLSSSGIGSWTTQNYYAIPPGAQWFNDVLDYLQKLPSSIFQATGGVTGHSCTIGNAVLYCVGGAESFSIPILSGASISIPTDVVLYARIDSDGNLGAWQYGGHYAPGGVENASCAASAKYLYCVGGESYPDWWSFLNPLTIFSPNSGSSQVWYAPLHGDGSLGAWKRTTDYGGGDFDGGSCSIVATSIVCVGGGNTTAWMAPLAGEQGVGQWTQVGGYPSPFDREAAPCVSAGTTLYCIGGHHAGWLGDVGFTNGTYFQNYKISIDLNDAVSCGSIGGAWDSGACTVPTNFKVNAGESLRVDPGVTLIIGGPDNVCPSGDCEHPLEFVNTGFLSVSGNLINYGNFNNSTTGSVSIAEGGSISNYGNFLNSGNIGSSGKIINLTGAAFTNAGTIVANDSDVANAGNITVFLNSATCQNDSTLFGANSFFEVFGVWNAGVCTVGLTRPGVPAVDQALALPQGYTIHIPPGTTLLNQGEFDVHGIIESEFGGVLVNQGFFTDGNRQADTGVLAVDGHIANSGLLKNQQGATFALLQGGSATNPGEIDDLTGSSIYVNPGASLTTCGTIRVDSSSSLFDLSTIDNCGVILNSGNITTSLNVLALINNISGGKIVNQENGTTNGAGGTLTGTLGSITVDLNAASCSALGGAWTPANNTCVAGLTGLPASAPYGQILRIPQGVTLENFGELDVYGALQDFGVILNHTNASLLIGLGNGLGSLTVESTGALFNYDYLSVEQPGSSLTNNGSLTNAGLRGLRNLGTLTNSAAVTNFGPIQNLGNVRNTGTITECGAGSFSGSSDDFTGNTLAPGPCGPASLEPTGVTLTSATNPITAGQTVTLTATVLPGGGAGVTGTVTFYDGLTILGTASLSVFGKVQGTTVTGNQASISVALAAAGAHSLTAHYDGDSIHAQSTSPAVSETVRATSNVFLSSTPNPSILGQQVTLTASVTPSAATGVVTFYDGANALGQSTLTGGVAVLNTSILAAGSRSLTAVYGGDANDAPSQASAPVNQTVTAGSPFGGPDAIVTADFNGDGTPDIAVANATDANSSGNTVSVLLGDGNGAFRLVGSYPTGSNPAAIAAGDFNSDTRPDLVVANRGSATVSVLLGNGDGTFQSASSYGATFLHAPVSVAIGDFNEDGKADLAVADFIQPGAVTILLNDGSGSFGTPANFAAGAFPRSIAVGDLDADGHPDLVTANQNDTTVSVLSGQGGGVFRTAVNYSVSSASFPNPVSVALADFNGDGKPDIAVAKQISSGDIGILLGNGDATFQPVQNFNAGIFPTSLATGDFNGDAKMDLAITATGNDGATPALLIVQGNGDGTFQTPITHPAGTGPSYVAVADLNKDGASDAIAVNSGSNDLTVVTGVSTAVEITVNTSPAGLSFVADGTAWTGSHTFSWIAGSSHTVSTQSLQAAEAGTRYALTGWSDGGDASHGITVPSAAATYTASFGVQYLLTTSVAPAGSGTVTALPSSPDGYYGAGSPVQLTATPGDGYGFSNWNAGMTGTSSPVSFTMNAPTNATAEFLALLNQSINFPAPQDVTFGIGQFTVRASASSGLDVTVSSNTPGVCTVLGVTVSVAHAGPCTLTAKQPGNAAYAAAPAVTRTFSVRPQQPAVTWAEPGAIVFGAALGPNQLNASANVPGTFVYTPAAGTVLRGGNGQTLSVTFTPDDATDYATVTTTTAIDVNKVMPVITWPSPAPIVFGGALGSTQLNATASVPGAFVYTPAAGTVLPVGNGQTLSVSFTPSDTVDYATAVGSTTVDVTPAPVSATPAHIVVTNQLTRVDGNVIAVLTLANNGGSDAENVTITAAKIGITSGAPLPLTAGTIAAGGTAQVTVTFPGSVGGVKARSSLSVSGSYTGGSFSAGARIVLP